MSHPDYTPQEHMEAWANKPAAQSAPEPLTDDRKLFNAVINFAIGQGINSAEFLIAWREGDTSEWPEFDANGITEKGQP